MKRIIIGLDLSLNSTGVCMSFFNEKMDAEYLSFYNLIFDDNSHAKEWTPIQVPNVVRETYSMPSNICPSDLVYRENVIADFDYNQNQMNATLKAMMAVKRLMKIINSAISDYSEKENDEMNVMFCVEGYLTPVFVTHRQMQTISELTIMQGLLRSEIIKMSIAFPNLKMSIETVPPKTLKKFFTGKGNAEKKDMIHTFMNEWDGKRFIPETTKQKIDDVVDAFALMINMRSKIYKHEKI